MMSDLLSIIQAGSTPATPATIRLGERGEALAAVHLVDQGYRIVGANFKVPVGRNRKGVQVTGEIDLIALDGETLCFVEVKTRRSAEFTPVLTNVDLRKQRQITRTAKVYRRVFGIRDKAYRFDAVAVLIPRNAKVEIQLIKNFWNESKFRKQSWVDRTWDEFR